MGKKLGEEEILALCQAQMRGALGFLNGQAGAEPAEGAAVLQCRALWQ